MKSDNFTKTEDAKTNIEKRLERKCGQVDDSRPCRQADVDFILQATELLRSELGRALLMDVYCFRVDSGLEDLR